MPNGENGKNGRWIGEAIYRSVLVLMLSGIGGGVWLNAITTAKNGAVTVAHLANHPDAGLTTRIDLMQMEDAKLAERVRIIEIRLGPYDGE